MASAFRFEPTKAEAPRRPSTRRQQIDWLAGAMLWLVTTAALAFGNDAHHTIGAIADQQLAGTRAAAEVTKLLAPDETLSTAAIWADRAKGYCGPLTPEMHVFVSANPKHHDYHFTDVPFQLDH